MYMYMYMYMCTCIPLNRTIVLRGNSSFFFPQQVLASYREKNPLDFHKLNTVHCLSQRAKQYACDEELLSCTENVLRVPITFGEFSFRPNAKTVELSVHAKAT
jgi:hypothetical protein